MRSVHVVFAGLTLWALTAAACDRGRGGGGTGGTETGAAADTADPICADSTVNHLCPIIPHEVSVRVQAGYTGVHPDVQAHFDVFSWQSFVALNWPADSKGQPTGGFADNPSTPRVWEYWQDAAEVYNAGTATPCNVPPGQKFMGTMAKNGDVVDPDGDYDEAVGGPLADVNVNYVLYEKKINSDEVAYLRTHNLTTPAGQFAADSADTALVFPQGSSAGPLGAMELKAAWRILQPQSGDDTTRFFTRRGTIYVPARNSGTGKDLCIQNVLLGLIALHIIHKTEGFGNDWIWSTFEHEDNAPLCPGTSTCSGGGRRWSLYDSLCVGCATNDSLRLRPGDTTFLWAPQPPYAQYYALQGKYGNQITRTQVTPPWTARVDSTWVGRVANTVWQHYRLVGSQWMTGEPHARLVPVPDTLRNTALESYLPYSSSCLGCHAFARTLADTIRKDTGVFADFSFLLGMAKPRSASLLPLFSSQRAMGRTANVPFRHASTVVPPIPGQTGQAPAPPAAPAAPRESAQATTPATRPRRR
jgi:hypothetical protein